MQRNAIAAVGLLSATLFMGSPASAADGIVIGTGGKTGVYFATGGAVCHAVGDAIPCEAKTSGGSVANLKALAAGEINFAMVQSDWQFHAHRGSSQWKGEKFDGLRAVMSVYAEPLQIVAKRDAGINKWRDLKGKRVNVGNVGSGHRQTFELVMQTERWKMSAFNPASEYPLAEKITAFCDGKLDAFVYTIGVPSAAMQRAVAECAGHLIAPAPTTVRKLATAGRPYYAKVRIPAGTYWDKQKAVRTFGVVATLVTREDVPVAMVETVVKSVFENLETFKERHPAFASATAENMVKDGLSAPFHDAAAKYYQAKGWLKNF